VPVLYIPRQCQNLVTAVLELVDVKRVTAPGATMAGAVRNDVFCSITRNKTRISRYSGSNSDTFTLARVHCVISFCSGPTRFPVDAISGIVAVDNMLVLRREAWRSSRQQCQHLIGPALVGGVGINENTGIVTFMVSVCEVDGTVNEVNIVYHHR
jgi:hypothetical protein